MGRFIQEDPIGTKDDTNLYRYVANNPINYVDRFGLEKVLIMIGEDKMFLGMEASTLKKAAKIQYQKYIDAGYKSTNIETKFIKNIADINFNITNKKYKEVAISAHGSQNGIKLSNNGDTINSDTVSLLKKSSNQNLTLTLVSCMTGYGDDSIAEQIAKRMGITVMAPSSILNVFNEAEFMDGGQHTPGLNYNGFQFVESQILANINGIGFPAQFYSYN